MVACLKPQKAPLDFIDVAARVLSERKDVHFVMAGDGELRPQVEERMRTHAIEQHVPFSGWQKDMPEVIRNLDIVVLTSLWEGLPCVFSEAMASELPIVATNVDGAREAIIQGETGYLHTPHDIDGMAHSVLKLVTSPELRREMGERGRLRVPEFDISASVTRWKRPIKNVSLHSRIRAQFCVCAVLDAGHAPGRLQMGIVDRP